MPGSKIGSKGIIDFQILEGWNVADRWETFCVLLQWLVLTWHARGFGFVVVCHVYVRFVTISHANLSYRPKSRAALEIRGWGNILL